jgi:hypothetical protein
MSVAGEDEGVKGRPAEGKPMDIMKLKQAVDGIRERLAAGDKAAAIALYRDAFGADEKSATDAVEQIAAGKPVAVTHAVDVMGEVGANVRQILQVVPGGGLAGMVLKFAGVDLTKLTGAETVEGGGKTMRMSLPTMTLSGTDRSAAPASIEAAPEPAATGGGDRPRRVNVLERQYGRTVERPRGLGIVGVAVLLLTLAVAAAAAILLLR